MMAYEIEKLDESIAAAIEKLTYARSMLAERNNDYGPHGESMRGDSGSCVTYAIAAAQDAVRILAAV